MLSENLLFSLEISLSVERSQNIVNFTDNEDVRLVCDESINHFFAGATLPLRQNGKDRMERGKDGKQGHRPHQSNGGTGLLKEKAGRGVTYRHSLRVHSGRH